MNVFVAGVTLDVDAPAFLRYYDSFEPLARPRFAAFCEREMRLCAIGVDCSCCASYGKTRTTSPHGYLPIGEVLAALRQVAA